MAHSLRLAVRRSVGVAAAAGASLLFAPHGSASALSIPFFSSAASTPTAVPNGGITAGAFSPAPASPFVTAPLAQQRDFDVVVVGGGIIGLAVAREILSRFPHKTVAVLEKEREVGPHQSSHNSGVIHAGIYYEPGSVMAKTCVRGAALMYDYCQTKGLPHERCGKLIVATDAKEDAIVRTLFDRATANGVQGLRLLNAAEIQTMEPKVVGTSALWSPNTGIADYGAVCRSLTNDILTSGHGDVKLQFEVKDMKYLKEAGRVEVLGVELGQLGPVKHVTAKHIITCGGFYADKISKVAGGATDPKVVAFRGTYYQMKPEFRDIVRTNVYPVPSGGGIPVGVHFTPTCNERRGHETIVGPGACIAFSREGYKMSDIRVADLADYVLNGGLWRFALTNPSLSIGELWKDFNKAAFIRAAQKLIPTCTPDMVEHSFSGVMAQVFNADGSAAKDYIFERKVLNGTVLNVRNAPSPAATSSLAIAEHVVDIATHDWEWDSAK